METRITSLRMVNRALRYRQKKMMMTDFQKKLVEFIDQHREDWRNADPELKRAIADVAVWHAL